MNNVKQSNLNPENLIFILSHGLMGTSEIEDKK